MPKQEKEIVQEVEQVDSGTPKVEMKFIASITNI